MKEVPGWIKAPLVIGLCGWLLWRELKAPARAAKESKLVRSARNLTVAAVAGAAVQYAEMPLVRPLAAWVEASRFGLIKFLGLPVWLEVPLAFMALDYTLYLWHALNHRVRFLWRFHQPHHSDRDMDASTALRFHFGEVALEDREEEQLVTLLEGSQVLILGDGRRFFQVAGAHARDLLLERRDMRWQQAVEPQRHAFLLGEGRALVGRRET